MSPKATRRDVLRRAALAAGTLSTPGLLRPALAAAQDDPSLEDFLSEAVVLEQIAVVAYSSASAALDGQRELSRSLQRFERHEQIHATALRSALDSLGIEPPSAPSAPDDAPAIEGAERIGAERTEELVELLGEIGELEGRDEHLEHLIEIENEQLALYLGATPGFDAEDLVRTGVEIAACQAQHIVVLREAMGAPPAEALPRLPAGEAD